MLSFVESSQCQGKVIEEVVGESAEMLALFLQPTSSREGCCY
jgi:hypothetical protein